MMEVALGIDIGTSGVRIAARGHDGALHAMTRVDMPAPMNGKQDVELWWQAVAACFASIDLTGLRVLALAIDGTSGTIVQVNAAGQPTAPASMYNDVADARFVKRIKDTAPPETAAHGATSPLARALAFAPGYYKVLHQADWLVGRFCGRFEVTDENNALKTGYDPVTRSWPAWLNEVGMAQHTLPEVVPAGQRIGTIRPELATAFNLPDDVAIVAGTTDGCAGFLASGANMPGDGVTSLGTTLTLKLLSATPVFAPDDGIYSHRIGDQWLAGGASNSGGVVLKQFFAPDDMVRLTALMNADVPTQLDYYPLPKVGERFPINDPTLEPRMTPRPPEDHVFLQGLLEGMTGIEALGYRRLAELGASKLTRIRTAGGGATNPVWTALRLKTLGVPEAPSASEHAAMGTARLAWRGIGVDA